MSTDRPSAMDVHNKEKDSPCQCSAVCCIVLVGQQGSKSAIESSYTHPFSGCKSQGNKGLVNLPNLIIIFPVNADRQKRYWR